MNRTIFLNTYWNYYLMLENKLINTFNYVTPSIANYETFSNEYASLIITIGSELDLFFKVFCEISLSKRANISHYCKKILGNNTLNEHINKELIIKGTDLTIRPFEGWNTSQPAKSFICWQDFDYLKHNRIDNQQRGNLINTLNILGALYILEMNYLLNIIEFDELDRPDKKSQLFDTNWPQRFSDCNYN